MPDITRSLNEIESTVLKAARGAGAPLGHAEDMASAAVYIAGTSPEALGCVFGALSEPHQIVDLTWSADSISIKSGGAIMIGPLVVDALSAGAQRAELPETIQLELVIAMLAVAGIAVEIKYQPLRLIVTKDKIVKPRPGPVYLPEMVWERWDQLARQTYVPATNTSRIAGAGAGLTDND